MSKDWTYTVVVPHFLRDSIDKLAEHLDEVDPPQIRGAPRKVSNRDLAMRLIIMLHTAQSWRSFGDVNDTYRKRFKELRDNKTFETFFFNLVRKLKASGKIKDSKKLLIDSMTVMNLLGVEEVSIIPSNPKHKGTKIHLIVK